jgi:hypothetical protein
MPAHVIPFDTTRATTDYAIAVSRWRRAQGGLLREYQIVVDRGSRLPAPWFAQF